MRSALLFMCVAAVLPSVSSGDASVPNDPQKNGNTFKATTCGQDTTKSSTVTLPDGLRYQELAVGKGALAIRANTVRVRWTVWLPTGERLDDGTLQIRLDDDRLIAGLQEGIVGMRVGGKRRLRVFTTLGYSGSRTLPAMHEPEGRNRSTSDGPLDFEVTLDGIGLIAPR